MNSVFRYNKLLNQWVLFAPKRARRPLNNETSNNQEDAKCPFDEQNEHLTPNELLRIGDDKNWRCRIVPNLYNALSIDEDIKSYKEGCFELKSGFGAHEVIIETPNHHKTMFTFEQKEFFDYFNIIKLRVLDLKKDIRLKYFSLFKNHGINAGASQEHSHSQLIATPFIPPKIQNELNGFKEFKQKHERSFFDDLINDEKNFKKGLLFENSHFLAFCPYASKYPFEITIICKDDIDSIVKFKDEHIFALAQTARFVFEKLYNALGDIAFNMILKNGDIQNEQNPNRFHILITPRLYKSAGFELDTDIFINTFLPETATKILLGDK